MKIIAIIGENIEQSTKVRKEVIRGGIFWFGGSKHPEIHQDSKYLTLIIVGNMNVSPCDANSALEAINIARENGWEIVMADKFFEDSTIIPGWKEPKLEVMLPTPWGPTSLDLSPIVRVLKKHFDEAYLEGK